MSITGITYSNPIIGITTTIRLSGSGLGGTHRHLAVTSKWRRVRQLQSGGWEVERECWCLQWAERKGLGTHYEPPTETGFKTKREAEARKKEIYREIGWA